MRIQNLLDQTVGGESKRALSSIKKIARHHSATISGDYFVFERHWKSKGWKTGGYHEIILRDGTVQLCYGADVITNGIKNHNSGTYHISLVGNGSFTDEQEKSFKERCLLAMKRFGLSVHDVLGHNEFKGTSTNCPGIDMNIVRGWLKDSLVDSKQRKEVDKVKPLEEKKEAKTKGDTLLKTIQSVLNSRYETNLVIDGVFGPKTRKALIKGLQTELNKHYDARLVVDGVFGKKTKGSCANVRIGTTGNLVWLVQSALYAKGYNPNGIDGIFGKRTASAVLQFQKANNLLQDGIVGPNTFEKLLG